MSRRGRPLLSWQLGCKVPEKVPEKTPGAWLTKLSMTAPGLRDRLVGAGLLPAELLLRALQSTSEQEETTLLLTVCVLAPCDRNIPAVTGAGWAALQYMGVACAEGAGLGAGLCWQVGTTGMRAKLELVPPCSVLHWGVGPAAAPGSPRLAMTCRCWSCPPLC